MKDIKSLLIVARSGRLREGLQALIKTIPQIKIIGQVEHRSTALQMITEHHPDLVLLVTNLPIDDTLQILEHLSDEDQTKCLVLTDTINQQRQVEAIGVDEVLLTGFPATRLFETITNLLFS